MSASAPRRALRSASYSVKLPSKKTTWLSPDGVREETLAHSSLDAFVREFARLLGDGALAHITDATARRGALLDALRGRRVLLIWDNLETLTAEERGQIAEFLRKLPGANKAIITSRRRTGESALTIRLDRLSFDEAQQLMFEVGRRQPRVAHELAQSAPAQRLALYEAAGGTPLLPHQCLLDPKICAGRACALGRLIESENHRLDLAM